MVFYGDRVPKARVKHALQRLDSADAVLIVGSSLMVYSGYRFVRRAAEMELPIAAINLGVTRADPLLNLKLAAPGDQALPAILNDLGIEPRPRAGSGMRHGSGTDHFSS